MIHICYPCCHAESCKRYLKYSIDSVAKHNKKISITFLNSAQGNGEMEFNDDDIEVYRQILAKHGIKTPLRVFDVSLLMHKFYKCRSLKGQWNTYKRFFINKVYKTYMPEVNRVLYLDEDTICTGSLEKLYNEDMKGRPYMGFIDAGVWNPKNFKLERQLCKNNKYINAGVILIDVNYDIYPELEKLIQTAEHWHKQRIHYFHDQTIINSLCPSVFKCSMVTRNNKKEGQDYYKDIARAVLKKYNIIHYWGHKCFNRMTCTIGYPWDVIIGNIIDM